MSKISDFFELKPEELRWHCPEDSLNFVTTKELEPLNKIVGQHRAIEALRLGAELRSQGYNIFVSGLSGTGRLSTVENILQEVTTSVPLLFDFCYVNNFINPDYPRLLKLYRGKGKELFSLMEDSMIFLRNRIPKLFEEESYLISRKNIIEEYQLRERQILHIFDEKILPFGFIRGQIENDQGIVTPEVFPLVEGQAVPVQTLPELVAQGKIKAEEVEKFNELFQKFHNELFDLARESMKIMQEFKKSLEDNDKASASIIINSVFDDIALKMDNPKVTEYINEAKEYALKNITMFAQVQNPITPAQHEDSEVSETDKFSLFKINVVLDNSNVESAPIIKETTPSYINLFGTIDRSYDTRGYWVTDFTKIKAGSILKADQGFLIVNADDLFSEPGVWMALKRVLLYNKLEIQPFESFFQLSQLHMKPEAVEVDVKVVIIGGISLYKLLYEYEKGFKKIFKVNAQFDYETNLTQDMITNYARFISKICEENSLPHCTPDGAAAIIEWAVEKAGSQKKITLKFSDVADVIRESAFYDKGSERSFINREDVRKAINWRRHRNDMLDEKMRNYITEGIILIDTEGERVGQINGLTVMDDGLLSFGKPARITATVSAGSTGIINIEREVEMSGAIHSKGVLIINGFIKEKFAQNKPLTLSASIAFEQSYSGIDGDSASAAEILVLMSALSNIPIRQNLAITGSVNQKGDIQPIGGINEKIRGFFEICRDKGFTGNQGIVLPIQNITDLMLCEEVVDAVREGNFHIYPVKEIEEVFPLMMGVEAGVRDDKGTYPEGTVFFKVEQRFEDLRKALKEQVTKKAKKSKNKSEKSK